MGLRYRWGRETDSEKQDSESVLLTYISDQSIPGVTVYFDTGPTGKFGKTIVKGLKKSFIRKIYIIDCKGLVDVIRKRYIVT